MHRAQKHLGHLGWRGMGFKRGRANGGGVSIHGGIVDVADESQNRRNAWRLIGPNAPLQMLMTKEQRAVEIEH
jgi:hypothetical protein